MIWSNMLSIKMTYGRMSQIYQFILEFLSDLNYIFQCMQSLTLQRY